MWKDIRVRDQAPILDTAVDYKCSLPKALISALHIRINGTGGSGAALAYTNVEKARISTDGLDKKPLDLSATQLVRREGILFGIPPAIENNNGAYSAIPFNHYFGTRARDKRLMLDLRKANKRELFLKFDAVLFDAVTKFTAGTIVITIIAVCWVGETPPEYQGHIRMEEALSLATGTGDTQPQMEMPLHSGGKLAFMDFTVSDTTTVENIELSANGDRVSLLNIHFRDLVHRMNYQRHLDTILTLTAYVDYMFVDRFMTQLVSLPLIDQMKTWKLVVERGTTTTTVVVVLGTILA